MVRIQIRHGEDSDSSEYIPEEDEGGMGGGTDLDEEQITITTSKVPSPERRAALKKSVARKKLATKPRMPPGSSRASKRVLASSPADSTPGVATRSSKRQVNQEPMSNVDQANPFVEEDLHDDGVPPSVQQNQTIVAGK
uniref:Uncharacterized protein n=1 Tax=Leersia perrieri TaxID=77586 RepID=A0A0D9WZH2_9ORYZ